MEPKFIFTADDYGPIDFINRGICHAVSKGLVNSVHVLSNIGKGQLKEALQQLSDHVPKDKTLDIGLHLTLTSGGPLYRKNGENWEGTWGKMMKGGAFKPFTKFYFGYRYYLLEIMNEFEAQLHQLTEALSGVSNSRLNLTSVSHHHGIFAIDDVLFQKYAQEFSNGANLAVRSPKALPASANNSFFDLVVPLFNTTDRREDRYEMEHMQAAFVQNQFFSTSDLKIKSPSYIDVSHYGSLGSLSRLNIFAEKRIEKRVAAFDEMIDRAKKYTLVTKSDPNEKIVEFVFHLGDHTQKPRGFNQEVKHYSGVNPKYFEDRQHEVIALEQSFSKHRQSLQNNLVSWQTCGEVNYIKAK